MNIILAFVSISLSCFILAAYCEPTVADWVIRKLRARAAGLRASRRAYIQAYGEAHEYDSSSDNRGALQDHTRGQRPGIFREVDR